MDAALQTDRRGNTSLDRENDHRKPFERDLARLIHSAGFRRLQAKTQVLGIGEGDFHRTRLTHSMEVAQIGKGLVRNLRHRKICRAAEPYLPDDDLILFAGLAHDLGHPPFGHGGEIALNISMQNSGGFEGNGQTLRLLSKLEAHTPEFGLNLTRRSLLSILKYPVSYQHVRRMKLPDEPKPLRVKHSEWKPPKCYHDEEQDVVDWILDPLEKRDRDEFTRYSPPTENENGKPDQRSFDASIMELADDIAYGVHDLEDAIALRLVTKEDWSDFEEELGNRVGISWSKSNCIHDIGAQLFGDSWKRKRAIGALVHAFMVNTEIEQKDYSCLLLRYRLISSSEAKAALEDLKDFVKDHVVMIPEVQTLEYRGKQIVIQIFDAIRSDPSRLLKTAFKKQWEMASRENEEKEPLRIICDYISGMTDEYATRLYERLFVPRHGTVFQRL